MGNDYTGKHRIKCYEDLTFADDFMFCKILQNDPGLCRELLELILERKVSMALSVESQKTIEITADAKGVRFDVYLDDDEDHVYDIEMQTTTKKHLPKRMRYYQGMLDLNLIERGAQYEELKQSYIIFICLENPYPAVGLHKYTFAYTCRESPGLILKDDAIKMILSANGNADDVSPELSAFLRYLATQETTSDFTKRLATKVETARQHNRWRGEYMTLEEKYREFMEEGHEIGIKEGLERGREIGIKEGREEGLERGREIGIKEGREEGLERGRELGVKEGLEEGLERGREIGIKEGLEEGRARGRAEGRAKGLAEGRAEEQHNTEREKQRADSAEKALADRDAEIAALKAEIEKLKRQIL